MALDVSNARKSQNVKHNNGVGIEKKFTPPSPPPLNHVSRGDEMTFKGGGGEKKISAIFAPHSNITPPLKVFLDPPLHKRTAL